MKKQKKKRTIPLRGLVSVDLNYNNKQSIPYTADTPSHPPSHDNFVTIEYVRHKFGV